MESDDRMTTLERFILVIVGFALTTVVGGLLGSYLQYLSWSHQWYTERAERDISIATSTFERISSLIDQRNYRMRRLIWAIKGNKSSKEIDERLSSYLELLFSWNDNLNSNYSLAQIYFGNEIRSQLENRISRGFVDVGFGIECEIQKIKGEQPSPECKSTSIDDAEQKLEALGYEIYGFNLKMLESIKVREDAITTAQFRLF